MTNWPKLHGEQLRDVRVLVTGGAGFIGSHLSAALASLGARVVVLDDLSGGQTANLNPIREAAGERLEFVQGSILDAPMLGRAMTDCRYVFHQAAIPSVPLSVEQPVETYNVNLTGTLNVLQAARSRGVKRVMFAASSSAYGDGPQLPKIETIPPDPKSPYAAQKLAGEHLMRVYAQCYDLDTVSLRYFNIFGPRQNANSAYAGVIAAFAKALGRKQRVTIFGDGNATRDFTYVDNAVHANLLAALGSHDLGGEVMNIGCGLKISINQLAATMAKITGQNELTPNYAPPRAGDVDHSQADITRAKQMIGYAPIVDFDAGLTATLDWYRANG